MSSIKFPKQTNNARLFPRESMGWGGGEVRGKVRVANVPRGVFGGCRNMPSHNT